MYTYLLIQIYLMYSFTYMYMKQISKYLQIYRSFTSPGASEQLCEQEQEFDTNIYIYIYINVYIYRVKKRG